MTENMGSYAQQGPGPREPYAQQGPGPQDQPSATAVARDQAATVGRSAGEAGGHVAQTAADQAREVVSETARQARDLLGEAGGHARDQASVQQQKAASQLRSVADELWEMTAKGGQSGVATEVAQQAAERIHGMASWLEQREPADVLQAVRDFARRRPGVFLAGAVAAGLAAGRLTRGMTDAARSGGQRPDPQRPPREIPPGAAIPPPPDPDWTTPMPGYPAGTEPYYPAGGVAPARRRARARRSRRPASRTAAGHGYQGSGYEEGGFPEQRPGDLPARAAAVTPQDPDLRASEVVGETGRDVGRASVGELIGEVTRDMSTLMRQELALAKAEVKEEAVKAARAGGMLGAAGFAGYMVLLFASIAAWWGLAEVMAAGWAALVVTAIWAVIGAVLFAVGRQRMREVNPKPERTVETVSEVPGTLKGAVRR